MNVLWGFFNLEVAYVLLYRVGAFELRRTTQVSVAGLGALAMFVILARHLARLHGGL